MPVDAPSQHVRMSYQEVGDGLWDLWWRNEGKLRGAFAIGLNVRFSTIKLTPDMTLADPATTPKGSMRFFVEFKPSGCDSRSIDTIARETLAHILQAVPELGTHKLTVTVEVKTIGTARHTP